MGTLIIATIFWRNTTDFDGEMMEGWQWGSRRRKLNHRESAREEDRKGKRVRVATHIHAWYDQTV